ncbi:MAG: PAS domain-containing protein [Betaproteobacteria bacterium]|nr:PAS domain-containing protein [Betaproteobacteria bacterium]
MAPERIQMKPDALQGLDLLSTAVLLVDTEQRVRYLNPAAEDLFRTSRKSMIGQTLQDAFVDSHDLEAAVTAALRDRATVTQHDLALVANTGTALQRTVMTCTVTPYESDGESGTLVELSPTQQQLRIAREERLLGQTQANRELLRNLAHEIKNPLGALRGAAQLLERELDRADQREYTQVIMSEADRLQSLMDRMLTPHRLPKPVALSIHEVTERVRTLLLAEFPGIAIKRDYDSSLPNIVGDREQLIQAVLNVARNAAQAMKGHGTITFRSRILRQLTLGKKLYRLAVSLDVIDDGPGIPDEIKERVFFPLISGREGGTGLGLTIAQTFVHQHHGIVEVESRPGETCFTILLPITETVVTNGDSNRNQRH